MPIRRLVAASTLLLASFGGGAAETAVPAPDSALEVYAKPGTLVDIGGGRKLNLRCSGEGTPVVMLESGATADSMAWHKVQPSIAKTTRVCAYDRAGFGFSDDGPLPRDLDADAKDLHALIHAAKIATPVVLVGHSLGTNIVRRYAGKYSADVGAIVLVDPPPQHVSEFSKEWVAADNGAHEQVIAFAKMCGKAASAGELAKPAGDAARCIRPPDPRYPDALSAAIHAQKERLPFWHTLISEFETNMTIFEEPVSPKESHGAKPLIVLVADGSFADAPPDGKTAMEAAQQKTNKLILATSTRSERRWVANSSHDMQFDQPDAIVAAVADATKQVGARPK
jgi:pimeloyl-ACP methyl ester carboxylesterase